MKWRLTLIGLVATLALTGCGGGDDPYKKAVVFGDSLSDVGTYQVGFIAANSGGRWTINGVPDNDMWVDRVASSVGVSRTCAAETGLQPNNGIPPVPVTAVPGCFNYAQGSARINSPLGPNSVALQSPPFSQATLGLMAKPIQQQIARHLAVSSNRFSSHDLVMVLAGANDVFMEATFNGTNPTVALANMQQYGTDLANLIKNEVVANGAKRVLVLNVPSIASTPFGTAAGPTAGPFLDQLVTAFNGRLAAGLAGVPEVRLVDAYAVSIDQANNPLSYGILNRIAPACSVDPMVNPLGGSALVCTSARLATGVTTTTAQTYQYADNVHPTPLGHRLLADLALQQLSIAGWR
jgi:outer membrane lipase/esterase